jgi:hypothetical protein
MKRPTGVLGVATLAVVVSIAASSALAAPPGGVTATPASTKQFNGSYSAKFVRSASGIINETSRINSGGAQNPWTSFDVWLQFRPPTHANPSCDSTGLVTPQFTYTNDQSSIAGTQTTGYFLNGVAYNVCVYVVTNQVVASGAVDSAEQAGTSVSLPLNGQYRIDVSGTWQNGADVPTDAEYSSLYDWSAPHDGFDYFGFHLGPNLGDLTVGGQFVNWGAYNQNHAYSYTAALPAGSLNLAVFDGENGVAIPSWYGDNGGSLNYTITYLG